MNQDKHPELERLIDVAEQVGDVMNEDKSIDQGFMLIVNHGKTSTTAVVGTGPCLASALYTSCKSSEELTMIIMAVAAQLVHGGIKKRDEKSYEDLLMGPKGDA
jgi:hypothetical protein